MRFDVLTLFPDFVRQAMGVGVVGRALERGQVALSCWNPRDYTSDNYRTVDDRPYGGGPGMVFMIEPLRRALAAASADGARRPVVLMSPQGRRFDQALARQWAAGPGLTLVCGRYEGIDQRFVDRHVDLEVSIGDFVLSGGELPALAVMDAVTRLLRVVFDRRNEFAHGTNPAGTAALEALLRALTAVTTTSPGRCANQASSDCECCAADADQMPIGSRATSGKRPWPPNM